jgi:biopolymer transport protein TolR
MRRNNGPAKKDLDAQLILTPFIDLLSTCVCFLLVTAVWIQIGTVEVKQSHGTDAAPDKKDTFDMDLVFKDPKEMRLNLKKNGKQIKAIDIKSDSNDGMLTKLNDAIVSQVLNAKEKIVIATATVTPRSTVDYGQLISTLDVLRKNQIVNIGVLTAKGQ